MITHARALSKYGSHSSPPPGGGLKPHPHLGLRVVIFGRHIYAHCRRYSHDLQAGWANPVTSGLPVVMLLEDPRDPGHTCLHETPRWGLLSLDITTGTHCWLCSIL